MDDSGEIKVREENQFAVGEAMSDDVRSFQINFGQIYVGKVQHTCIVLHAMIHTQHDAWFVCAVRVATTTTVSSVRRTPVPTLIHGMFLSHPIHTATNMARRTSTG